MIIEDEEMDLIACLIHQLPIKVEEANKGILENIRKKFKLPNKKFIAYIICPKNKDKGPPSKGPIVFVEKF